MTQYITICPGQDMCHGDTFRRRYAFEFSMAPACIPCDCDDSCVRKSTCCPSKFLHIKNSSNTNEMLQENVYIDQPPLSCVQPLWNTYPEFNVQGYWLINSCPSGDPCDAQKTDINSSTPVTSSSTNETYLNVDCALCNNENSQDLVFWKQNNVLCQDRTSLLLEKTLRDISELSTHQFPECNVLFYPPATVADIVKRCPTVSKLQRPCNDSGRLSMERSYLVQACNSYHLPYTDCYMTYKNVFCALCFTDSVNQLPIECNKDVGFSANQFPMFSALIDFDKEREIVVAVHDRNCGVGQVFDRHVVSRNL
jgi:hypothetical protein